MPPDPIAAAVRAELDARELTIQDLADLSGIHIANLSKWLLGKRAPRIDTVIKIAAALDLELTLKPATPRKPRKRR